MFLDVSKAFDKVWHDGLLYKIRQLGIDNELLPLLKSFLSNRKQRVVLNGQCSDWNDVTAGVPQGSVLGPLFFLIYINDLPTGLESNVKMFADDTSIFSVVTNSNTSYQQLNHDLLLINNWAHQWKMSFNPDLSKQAVEILFSRKRNIEQHRELSFNNMPITVEPYQKHLGLVLDSKLSFNQHLKDKICKANKGIGVIKRLRCYLPRKTLLTIYKSFVRPHLDYADIIYDQPSTDLFKNKIECVQYNAALAITGCIRGTSREKIYQELGIEALSDRRWCRKLLFFYKIVKGYAPEYLQKIIPNFNSNYITRHARSIRNFKTRTNCFNNSFFPHCIKVWNSIDPLIRSRPSVDSFKNSLLCFIKPTLRSVYNLHQPYGVMLLSRLRVGLTHLKEHKFRHNFKDTSNPLCLCNNEPETTEHYLLRCHFYSIQRRKLFDSISQQLR